MTRILISGVPKPQVTVDLDVLVRDDLLRFLKKDSEERGATIVCMYPTCSSSLLKGPFLMIKKDATHIFDGLDGFPTHVAHMRLGTFVTAPTPWPFPDVITNGTATRLYSAALQWLREDRDHRRGLEVQGRKKRGAKSQEVSTVSIWLVLLLFTSSGNARA